MGYRTAAWVDPGKPPVCVDYLLRAPYRGYAEAVNVLSRRILEMDRDCIAVVTGGDDIHPDTRTRVGIIAESFRQRWPDLFGIMQPRGTGTGVPGGEAGSAVSPWMGRGWISRAYGGKGPLWAEYPHYYVDTELRDVAMKLGVYWERPDLYQRHDHWATQDKQMPPHLAAAQKTERASAILCCKRRDNGFPGHEPIP